ncbi:MAG: hypothetical protein KC546_06245 [Anaerolineae bacterium]|nr:hypothetical protein [Anaerolineae bacterium]MCA9887950.1 hypothetical protein [Anaerolineae bacterium]
MVTSAPQQTITPDIAATQIPTYSPTIPAATFQLTSTFSPTMTLVATLTHAHTPVITQTSTQTMVATATVSSATSSTTTPTLTETPTATVALIETAPTMDSTLNAVETEDANAPSQITETPSECTLELHSPGDISGEIADHLNEILVNYGQMVIDSTADINHDGEVDLLDFYLAISSNTDDCL